MIFNLNPRVHAHLVAQGLTPIIEARLEELGVVVGPAREVWEDGEDECRFSAEVDFAVRAGAKGLNAALKAAGCPWDGGDGYSAPNLRAALRALAKGYEDPVLTAALL